MKRFNPKQDITKKTHKKSIIISLMLVTILVIIGTSFAMFSTSDEEANILNTTVGNFYAKGTEQNPYKIQYIEDLVDLSNQVKNGDTKSGKYYVLTRTLDFNSKESYRDADNTTKYGNINGDGQTDNIKTELTTGTGFPSIGAVPLLGRFMGIFDGNNLTIANLYISNKKTGTAGIGLFEGINDSVIKNLTISGEVKSDTPTGAESANLNIGGFVGLANNSRIENCHNMVNLSSASGNGSIGGLIGFASSNTAIINSDNKANVSGTNNTGGLIGLVGVSSNIRIENSHNEGLIKNDLGAHLGGLIGRDNAVTSNINIVSSYNTGSVEINNLVYGRASGLMGLSYGTLNISKSYNTGEVTSSITNFENNSAMSLGGIVGTKQGGTLKISETYNKGKVLGGNRAGGIVGFNCGSAQSVIDKSYNTADVTANLVTPGYAIASGGIVGYNSSSVANIINSYNTGSIESVQESGTNLSSSAGLIGDSDATARNIVINSYNSGQISSERYASGLVLGYNDGNYSYINNSYNIGIINCSSANKYEIGFFNKYEIYNVYYLQGQNASNLTNSGFIALDGTQMKSITLVNNLNGNIASDTAIKESGTSRTLEQISSLLNGYKLMKWELKDGYPQLIYN